MTGLILIIGEPVREFTAKSFWAKMVLLVLGIASGAIVVESPSGTASETVDVLLVTEAGKEVRLPRAYRYMRQLFPRP